MEARPHDMIYLLKLHDARFSRGPFDVGMALNYHMKRDNNSREKTISCNSCEIKKISQERLSPGPGIYASFCSHAMTKTSTGRFRMRQLYSYYGLQILNAHQGCYYSSRILCDKGTPPQPMNDCITTSLQRFPERFGDWE